MNLLEATMWVRTDPPDKVMYQTGWPKVCSDLATLWLRDCKPPAAITGRLANGGCSSEVRRCIGNPGSRGLEPVYFHQRLATCPPLAAAPLRFATPKIRSRDSGRPFDNSRIPPRRHGDLARVPCLGVIFARAGPVLNILPECFRRREKPGWLCVLRSRANLRSVPRSR